MADGFEQMIDASTRFFKGLKADNTKSYYEAHKSQYVDEIKKPAELFGQLAAETLSTEFGASFGFKLFRIHRDVRFSKDKTPYNTHLHLLWPNRNSATLAPSWFMGYAADYFTVGMGIMSPDKDQLSVLRHLIDQEGDALQTAIDDAHSNCGASISDWGPKPLVRVPKPYDADHPHGDLLRRKSFTISADVPADWRNKGLMNAFFEGVRAMRPVYAVLAQSD